MRALHEQAGGFTMSKSKDTHSVCTRVVGQKQEGLRTSPKFIFQRLGRPLIPNRHCDREPSTGKAGAIRLALVSWQDRGLQPAITSGLKPAVLFDP